MTNQRVNPDTITKPYRLLERKTHYSRDEWGRIIKAEAGSIHELTPAQIEAWPDRFVPVDAAPEPTPAPAPEPEPAPAAPAAPEPTPDADLLPSSASAEPAAPAPAPEPAAAAPPAPEPATTEPPAAPATEPAAAEADPIEDPGDTLAKQLIKEIRTKEDVGELEAMSVAEGDGKARPTVLEAIDTRIAQLTRG